MTPNSDQSAGRTPDGDRLIRKANVSTRTLEELDIQVTLLSQAVFNAQVILYEVLTRISELEEKGRSDGD